MMAQGGLRVNLWKEADSKTVIARTFNSLEGRKENIGILFRYLQSEPFNLES